MVVHVLDIRVASSQQISFWQLLESDLFIVMHVLKLSSPKLKSAVLIYLENIYEITVGNFRLRFAGYTAYC